MHRINENSTTSPDLAIALELLRRRLAVLTRELADRRYARDWDRMVDSARRRRALAPRTRLVAERMAAARATAAEAS